MTGHAKVILDRFHDALLGQLGPHPMARGQNEGYDEFVDALRDLVAERDALEAELESDPCAYLRSEEHKQRRRAVAAEAERDRLRALVAEAYPGDYPTNGWRKRAEDLGAWPLSASEREEGA